MKIFKILLVEDDLYLNKSLTDLLESKDYLVDRVYTLQRARQLIKKNKYDLAIIDRMLEDGDGLELARRLHQTRFTTKIFMLTHKRQTEDRVSGLALGADDYLGKPFSYAEFMLRVKRLLNTEKLVNRDYLKAGELKLFVKQGVVLINQKRIQLRKKETQILALLIRYQNTILSREAICNRVWQKEDKQPNFNTIDVYLRRIRIKFGQYKDLIETVRGFGYRLNNGQN